MGVISSTKGCYQWDDALVSDNNGNSRMDAGRKGKKNRMIHPVYRFNHFSIQLTKPERNCDQPKVRPAGLVRFLKPWQKPSKITKSQLFSMGWLFSSFSKFVDPYIPIFSRWNFNPSQILGFLINASFKIEFLSSHCNFLRSYLI